MKWSKLNRLTLVTVLLLSILLLGGCPFMPIDRTITPHKIENSLNAFKIYPITKNDKVIEVVVCEGYETSSKFLWKIIAVESVFAKDFIVTVGTVPQGFKQLVPEGNKTFSPMPGKKYNIGILTDLDAPNVFHVVTSWVAEESKSSEEN